MVFTPFSKEAVLKPSCQVTGGWTKRHALIDVAAAVLSDENLRAEYDRIYDPEFLLADSTLRVRKHRANQTKTERQDTNARNNARRALRKVPRGDFTPDCKALYEGEMRRNPKGDFEYAPNKRAKMLLKGLPHKGWMDVKVVRRKRCNYTNMHAVSEWYIAKLNPAVKKIDRRRSGVVCVPKQWLREEK